MQSLFGGLSAGVESENVFCAGVKESLWRSVFVGRAIGS